MEGKDLEELRELVSFLKASGIAEFEMERPDLKVGLKFECQPPAAAAAAPLAGMDMAQLARLLGAQNAVSAGGESGASAAQTVETTETAAALPETSAPLQAEADPHAGAHIVKSPIVGTFYDASSPDAEPFVQVGDRVSSGQVLCIVEAMKLMNEFESDAAGEVVKVFVKTGQPVEYGQALFAVKG
jgi:acetyl-CoA carboxylase biotin carboxyl carrier protein